MSREKLIEPETKAPVGEKLSNRSPLKEPKNTQGKMKLSSNRKNVPDSTVPESEILCRPLALVLAREPYAV